MRCSDHDANGWAHASRCIPQCVGTNSCQDTHAQSHRREQVSIHAEARSAVLVLDARCTRILGHQIEEWLRTCPVPGIRTYGTLLLRRCFRHALKYELVRVIEMSYMPRSESYIVEKLETYNAEGYTIPETPATSSESFFYLSSSKPILFIKSRLSTQFIIYI